MTLRINAVIHRRFHPLDLALAPPHERDQAMEVAYPKAPTRKPADAVGLLAVEGHVRLAKIRGEDVHVISQASGSRR
jgi:hypothetical protein